MERSSDPDSDPETEPDRESASEPGSESTPEPESESESAVAALPDRSRIVWWLLALVVAALLVTVIRRFLGVIAFSAFLYYAGRPVSRRLEERVGSRARAASLTILLILVPFVAILGIVAAVALAQVLAIADEDLAELVADAVPGAETAALPETPQGVYALAVEYLRPEDAMQLLTNAADIVATLAIVMFEVTLLSAIVYLLLRGDREVAAWFRETVAEPGTTGHEYLRAVDEELEHIYVGQMVTMFAVIVLAWVLYAALDFFAPAGLSLPFPLLFALLSGVATFVPVIGRSLVYVPIGIVFGVQALQTDPVLVWYAGFAMLAGWFGLDPAVRYGVRPYLTSHGVSPGLMLLAYVSSGAIFGWYGVFLAPLLLVGTLQFLHHVFPALLHGEPITAGAEETGDG